MRKTSAGGGGGMFGALVQHLKAMGSDPLGFGEKLREVDPSAFLAVLAWALQVPVVRAIPFRLLALWTVIIVYLAGLSLGLLMPLAAWQARRAGKARA